MEQTRKKSTSLYWILFLASTALLAYGIFAHWEYLTLILPFMVTFFAKALDIMWTEKKLANPHRNYLLQGTNEKKK